MLIEYFGWLFIIYLIVILSKKVKNFFKKKKKMDTPSLQMSDDDINHYGPFSGKFQFSKKKDLPIILMLLFNMNFINAAEKDINEAWCESMNGITEYRTKYGTFVDCLTDEYAIEMEFDYNWKEAVGQSLHYAEATGRLPSIVLIKRQKSKKDYFAELQGLVVEFSLPIKLFIINEEDN